MMAAMEITVQLSAMEYNQQKKNSDIRIGDPNGKMIRRAIWYWQRSVKSRKVGMLLRRRER